jgi:hypothetical protein
MLSQRGWLNAVTQELPAMRDRDGYENRRRRLHLKGVCVKRPVGDVSEVLIIAFRGFYCTINVFGAADVDRLLEAFESMSMGTQCKVLKKRTRYPHMCMPFPDPCPR